MEKINTDYLKDENEKFRLNFPRCTNCNVAPLKSITDHSGLGSGGGFF